MLLSAGHSVRPRPLVPWLRSLTEDGNRSFADRIADLNQLALISHFNGNTELARSICADTIVVIGEVGPPGSLHYQIQPWVNLGRLKGSNWIDASPHFRLPHYALKREVPPIDCPVTSWTDWRDDPARMRFSYAVFLIESAKALHAGAISPINLLSSLDTELCIPEEFSFALYELTWLAQSRLGQNSSSPPSPRSIRELVVWHYFGMSSSLALGQKADALDYALTAMLHIQSYSDDETADPYLLVGFKVCGALFKMGEIEKAAALGQWLFHTCLALNNELLAGRVRMMLANRGIDLGPAANETDYVALGAPSGSLFEEIVAARGIMYSRVRDGDA